MKNEKSVIPFVVLENKHTSESRHMQMYFIDFCKRDLYTTVSTNS